MRHRRIPGTYGPRPSKRKRRQPTSSPALGSKLVVASKDDAASRVPVYNLGDMIRALGARRRSG